jgi:hypothetical protein
MVMLFALTLLYFSGRAVQALPLLAADQSTPPSEQLPQGRTTMGIVWSCLATVIACVWVSVHPNVPGPNEGICAIAFRRLKIGVLALVTPELVTSWAIRQRLVAGNLAKKYNSGVLVSRTFTVTC